VIEFLFWEGCPSHERALSDLIELMDVLDIERDALRITEIHTHEDAVREKFIGSPTIRIDKTDVQDPGDTAYGMECRIYHHRDGRVSPLPDRDDVKHLLSEYAEQTHGG
jgi:hypothetical protein